MKGLFVTGTDTNVGKTITSAAILARYSSLPQLKYWKPIQTGIESDNDTATILDLTGLGRGRVEDVGVRLERPLSPHLSAKLAGVRIELGEVVLGIDAKGSWVVEGAGGLLVPINERHLMADLILALGLSVVVVARTTLGTINHTLLTIEACRSRGIAVAGVVMSGVPDRDNLEAIEYYSGVRVVSVIPYFRVLGRAGFLRWVEAEFDREGVLGSFL